MRPPRGGHSGSTGSPRPPWPGRRAWSTTTSLARCPSGRSRSTRPPPGSPTHCTCTSTEGLGTRPHEAPAESSTKEAGASWCPGGRPADRRASSDAPFRAGSAGSKRPHSLVEGVAAGAGAGRVRVVDREALLLDRVDEVDHGAVEVGDAHPVDHDGHTVEVGHDVAV